MAAIARAGGLLVETSAFEQWDSHGRRFDLAVSGQAWHWIDPRSGLAKLAAALDAVVAVIAALDGRITVRYRTRLLTAIRRTR